jgi:hypothetical protein
MILLALTWWCAAPSAHATWVYKRGGLDEKRVRLLIDAHARIGLNELYVSVGALPLDAPETANKIRALKASGMRLEALIDGDAPEQWIGRIVAYNRRQADPSMRFDGVHYDYEPWIGTGASTAWVTLALQRYGRATSALAGSGLPLSVDISGAKLAALPAEQQTALQGSVSRIIVMQYEMPAERVLARSDALLRQPKAPHAALIVALRSADFGCEVPALLQKLDTAYHSVDSYAGWALYEYETYADKCTPSH